MVRLSVLRCDQLYPPLSLAVVSVRLRVDPNGVVNIVNEIICVWAIDCYKCQVFGEFLAILHNCQGVRGGAHG